METRVELNNIRLIENLDQTFKSGNLYYVKGKNERGKTTFTLALKSILTGDVPSDMVTTGKEDGQIVGTITGSEGRKYKVIINLKEKGTQTFKIIDDQMNVSSKKTDLATIFNYTGITVEEFLGLGLTVPGRQKQAQLLINILPEDVQQQIAFIDGLLTEKEKKDKKFGEQDPSLYVQRKEIGTLLRNTATPEAPTEADIIKDQKLDEWQTRFDTEKTNYEDLLNEKARIEGLQAVWDSKKETYGDNYINDAEEAVKQAENALEKAKQELRTRKENVASLGERPQLPLLGTDSKGEAITFETKKAQYEKGIVIIEDAKAARQRIAAYKESMEKVTKLEKKLDELTEHINQKRDERQALVTNNLNVADVVIEDGELKLKTKDGLHDFTEKNIAFSTASKKMLEIMLILNPDYRIFTLGKASEFDENTVKIMADFAEKNDAIIVLDYVDNSKDEFTIECYEN